MRCLRVSGTEIRPPDEVSSTEICTPYAVSGTEIAYAGYGSGHRRMSHAGGVTRHPSRPIPYHPTRSYAMSGTKIAYGAISYAASPRAMCDVRY
eukprot:107613-Rhodomonas_salina.3